MKTYPKLLFVGMLLFSFVFLVSCEKDDNDDPMEPTLTETERLLTTKNWRYDRTIDYGQFDINTDEVMANQDTTETTRENRHMVFDMDGKAFYKDTAADTTTVEYLYSLNDQQTEMRLWEELSVLFFGLYSDNDYNIVQLDENNMVLKGDNKRRSAEEGWNSYSIHQLEFSSF